MRKLTYGAASSLDSYIAGEQDRLDWLRWTPEVSSIIKEYWKTVDTVLVGRKSYEVGRRSGRDSYPGMKAYVFSRTTRLDPAEGVEPVTGDAVEFVQNLKQGAGADICLMGGAELARSLFEARLIDEVGLNIHPVLLGSGVAMFLPLSGQRDLELLECRQLLNGCVYVRYRLAND